MGQVTSFGEANLVSYIKVEKKDGTIIYYKVVDGQNTEITEQEYLADNEEG